MQIRACFIGSSFYKYRGKQEYTIRLVIDDIVNNNKYLPNYCPFSMEEVERHLHELDWLLDETRSLKILEIKTILNDPILSGCYDKSPHDWIEFKIEVEGDNKWHRLVLIWARYLYESPFQFAMKDAYRIAEEFKINTFEASEIAMLAFNCGNVNHTLFGRYKFKFKTREEFVEGFLKLPSIFNKETNYSSKDNPSLQSLWVDDKSPSQECISIGTHDAASWSTTWDIRKETYSRIYERVSKSS